MDPGKKINASGRHHHHLDTRLHFTSSPTPLLLSLSCTTSWSYLLLAQFSFLLLIFTSFTACFSLPRTNSLSPHLVLLFQFFFILLHYNVHLSYSHFRSLLMLLFLHYPALSFPLQFLLLFLNSLSHYCGPLQSVPPFHSLISFPWPLLFLYLHLPSIPSHVNPLIHFFLSFFKTSQCLL